MTPPPLSFSRPILSSNGIDFFVGSTRIFENVLPYCPPRRRLRVSVHPFPGRGYRSGSLSRTKLIAKNHHSTFPHFYPAETTLHPFYRFFLLSQAFLGGPKGALLDVSFFPNGPQALFRLSHLRSGSLGSLGSGNASFVPPSPS